MIMRTCVKPQYDTNSYSSKDVSVNHLNKKRIGIQTNNNSRISCIADIIIKDKLDGKRAMNPSKMLEKHETNNSEPVQNVLSVHETTK